jgi:predicted HAD superfamily Cof-like phosphohydrolase
VCDPCTNPPPRSTEGAHGLTHPNIYRDVLDFNRAVLPGMVDRTEHGPSVPPDNSRMLGAALVWEEFQELMAALGVRFHDARGRMLVSSEAEPDIEGIVDAAADLFYVILGVVIRFGINEEQFHAVWREVTRANMEKTNGPLRNDGKRLKPENWRAPDIASCLWPKGEP